MFDYAYKRITIFLGHYGSGKTSLSVNFAKFLKTKGEDVVLVDLDVVNPYFRSRDYEKWLKETNIDLISSDYGKMNVDLVAIKGDIYGVLNDERRCVVIDVGGDDDGSYALASFAQDIENSKNYDAFLVINKNRFLTQKKEDVYSYIEEIERAGKLKITALVNNTNLGSQTTIECVKEGWKWALDVGLYCKKKVVFTSADENLKIPDVMNIYLRRYEWQN